MSRRYPTAELYEERQRDFYRNGNRSERSYDDIDPRRSAPDFFLHEDYDRRSSAGQLVVRERREEESTRGPPSRRREVEEDTLVIRGGRPEPRFRERDLDDISVRRSERDRPRARDVEREETDIIIKHRDHSRPRRPDREVERDDISFRRGEGGRPGRPREVDVEREEIKFSHRDRSRPREVERDEIIYRRDESRHAHHHHHDHEVEKERIVIRGRERSLPPPRTRGDLVAREREEFVVRRRPSPPPKDEIKDEIIIRRMEQRSPTPPPPPPPPPEPEPIVRPPIIQEVITHHRHIDHGRFSDHFNQSRYTNPFQGVERARSPSPPPPPPSPPRDESLEISIRRKETKGGTVAFDEEIIYDRDSRERKSRDFEVGRVRGRSLSAPRRSSTAPLNYDFESEAEYYNRKAMERAYPGEAYNGATKDWAIVDVPPGTNRVRMDGIGGGQQEITWQRYNGVRRSKFMSGDDEASTDYGMPNPVKPKPKDMWTEITKDLVIKEAIEQLGYDYEETDYFFYVMEYLRYVSHLFRIETAQKLTDPAGGCSATGGTVR